MWLPNYANGDPWSHGFNGYEKNTSTIAFDIKPQAVGIGPNGQEEATQKHCMNSDNQ
jgi:hypothetical protein